MKSVMELAMFKKKLSENGYRKSSKGKDHPRTGYESPEGE
jgi:hypothetical protein